MFIKTRRIVPFSNGSFVVFNPQLRNKFDSMDFTDDPVEFSKNYDNRSLKLMYVINDRAFGTRNLTTVIPVIFGKRNVANARAFSRRKQTYLFESNALVKFVGDEEELMHGTNDTIVKRRQLKVIANLINNHYKIDIKIEM